jgi:hypothetical protein
MGADVLTVQSLTTTFYCRNGRKVTDNNIGSLGNNKIKQK